MLMSPHHRGSEEGAVAITTAILLIALLLMAAIVVDLGKLRVDHRDSQSVADMAVTAGALELGGDINREAACNAAWAFVVNNLDEVADNEPQPAGNDCASNFSADCDPTVEDIMDVPLNSGDLRVIIRMPVPDGAAVMQASRQTLDPDRDGGPCERISVEVRRNQTHTLAGVAGFEEGSSLGGAVARRMHTGDEERFVSLMVLERDGCSTIRSSGGPSRIVVRSVTIAGVTHPGTISVDSVPSGTCPPNSKVFDVDSGRIFAEGDIFSHGLQELGSSDEIYDDAPPDLEPLPQSGPILRRANMDHRYNCEPGGYVAGPEPFRPESTSLSPAFRQSGVPPCEVTKPSYIKGLYEFLADAFIDTEDSDGDGVVDDLVVDGIDTAAEFAAHGFRVFPATPAEKCNDVVIDAVEGATSALWYFDCPSGATVKNSGEVVLPDVDAVVFAGGLDVSGTMWVNSDVAGVGGSADATLAVWDGDVSVSGRLTTRTTFTYINRPARGRLATNGSGGIDMEAPLGAGACTTGGDWPSAECFEDLAVWQNGEGTGPQDEMGLAGSGLLEVVGTIFVPNALINIGGGGATDVRNAQFFGWQFWYHGGGTLELIPNPDRGTPVKLFGAGLIR